MELEQIGARGPHVAPGPSLAHLCAQVCLCVKEIEDSELLEAMDAFDEESRANPAPQEPVTPVPPTAQVTSTAQSKILHVSQDYAGNNCCDLGKLSLKQISAPDDAEEKEETKEEEEKELAQLGAEEEGSSSDWPRQRACHTHERAIPIQQTVEALDLAEEGAATLRVDRRVLERQQAKS